MSNLDLIAVYEGLNSIVVMIVLSCGYALDLNPPRYNYVRGWCDSPMALEEPHVVC